MVRAALVILVVMLAVIVVSATDSGTGGPVADPPCPDGDGEGDACDKQEQDSDPQPQHAAPTFRSSFGLVGPLALISLPLTLVGLRAVRNRRPPTSVRRRDDAKV